MYHRCVNIKVLKLSNTHYSNNRDLLNTECLRKRLLRALLQWSSWICAISLSPCPFALLKPMEENAPGMGCGPKCCKILYFMVRIIHKRRALAFRNFP